MAHAMSYIWVDTVIITGISTAWYLTCTLLYLSVKAMLFLLLHSCFFFWSHPYLGSLSWSFSFLAPFLPNWNDDILLNINWTGGSLSQQSMQHYWLNQELVFAVDLDVDFVSWFCQRMSLAAALCLYSSQHIPSPFFGAEMWTACYFIKETNVYVLINILSWKWFNLQTTVDIPWFLFLDILDAQLMKLVIVQGKVNPTQCEALTMVCCQVLSLLLQQCSDNGLLHVQKMNVNT